MTYDEYAILTEEERMVERLKSLAAIVSATGARVVGVDESLEDVVASDPKKQALGMLSEGIQRLRAAEGLKPLKPFELKAHLRQWMPKSGEKQPLGFEEPLSDTWKAEGETSSDEKSR